MELKFGVKMLCSNLSQLPGCGGIGRRVSERETVMNLLVAITTLTVEVKDVME